MANGSKLSPEVLALIASQNKDIRLYAGTFRPLSEFMDEVRRKLYGSQLKG